METKTENDPYKEIAEGKLPDRKTLVRLIAKDTDRYVQALAAKALVDISKIQEDFAFTTDKEEIAILKVKIKHLEFQAERLLPTIYGNKIEITQVEKQAPKESEMQKIIDNAKVRLELCQKK